MTPSPLQPALDLLAAGKPADALGACERRIAEQPDDADAWHLSAQIYLQMGRLDDAACQLLSAQALRDDPRFAATQREIDLATLTEQSQYFQRRGQYAEAAAALESVIAQAPERAWAYNNLGNLHLSAGRLERAAELFRKAAFMRRPLYQAHSNLLMTMIHSDRVTPEQQLAEHRAWADRFSPSFGDEPPVLHDPDPSRPIRVGYVSPDFRHHPVAMFIRPVLEHHDRSAFEVTCYDDAAVNDAVKRKLQSFGHRWVRSAAMQYEDLFRQIRADRIDILIDLAVHSGEHRLPLFAAGAAPIQMTWLGYAGSTGCPSVQYRITDAFVDPPGLTESHFTEALLRLPDIFWCFSPFDDDTLPPGTIAATTTQPPAAEGEPPRGVRFGTATRLAKVTPTCLDLWCRLLGRVEGSTLALSAEPFGDASIRAEWLAYFTDRGVAAERVEMLPARGYRQYLEFLAGLDVGLDTFPFNGGTTVCQTLWMGTPVVALVGGTSVARVSGSVLSCLGLGNLVADSPERWVELNARLAADPAGREALRTSLRDRMRRSPLCDGPRFVRHVETMFRTVFQSHCARAATGA